MRNYNQHLCPCFSIIGTFGFLKSLERYLPGNYSIINSKTKEIKYLQCRARRDMMDIFNYLYDGATIYLDRKLNKWQEVQSAISK